jgi:hypothetical protein
LIVRGDDEGPLSRWSRRKTEARAGDGEASEPQSLDLPLADDNLPAELLNDDAPSEEAAEEERPPLPPIEELDADSDYTQFMADGVPEALTRAALRKLWLSDPIFANLDGLNDYDENFNLIDKIITAADTNYKVGRGMISDEDEDEVPPQHDEPVDEPVEQSAEEDVAQLDVPGAEAESTGATDNDNADDGETTDRDTDNGSSKS